MTKGSFGGARERVLTVAGVLEKLYPDAGCSLEYDEPWRLLFAARLSAQCTDVRVNKTTPALFAKFPTLKAFADAAPEDIEAIIKPCGLYKTKARDLKNAAVKILADFNGELPHTLEGFLTIPGVGAKTANLMMGDVYGLPAVVTDTHFIRITRRLGLTRSVTPKAVEKDMRELLPPEISAAFCHRTVFFGREYCTARNPKCDTCPFGGKSGAAAFCGGRARGADRVK
jgi:endonuclease-3